jgi:ABC-type lipoprotein release transport system permease subunit
LFVDGVSTVLQRFQVRGLLDNHGKAEILTLIAVNPEQELKNTYLWKKIIKGNYIANAKSEILISHATAKILNINPGEKIIFKYDSSTVEFIVAGIYKTGIDSLDRGIAFCPASTLFNQTGNWECAVFLDSSAEMRAIMELYTQLGLENLHLKTWEDLMPDLKQLIELNRISMVFVLVLVLGVVSFGIACAFSIFIINNIREYGIMKAMGVTPGETAILIFFEVILMNLLASFTGSVAGLLTVFIVSKTGIDLSTFTSHNQYFVVSGLIIPRLTPFSLCLPSVLAMVFSMLAAIWPVLIVVRRRTSDILRSI